MDNGGFSMQDAMRFAGSEAGQQLLALLQQTRSEDLDQAMKQAATGDLSKTKDAMRNFLSDPKVRELLNRMGDHHG